MKTFKGNFFEIGKQQGRIYRRNKANFKNVKISQRFYKGQLKVYKKYYPELLEEFEGVAKAGNFDKDKVIYKFITDELLWYINRFKLKKACTIFGVKNKNGVFVGRTYDWFRSFEKFSRAYKVVNPKRNSFIAVTDMHAAEPEFLSFGAGDAINNKGLFIGITFAFNNKWSYGLASEHLLRLAIEKCSTVKDAIKIFKKVPLCCAKNFFIADKKGEMAVVEHSSKRFKVLYPKNNILIKTNHYLHSELAKEDTVFARYPKHNTKLRYNEVLQKVGKRKENFDFPDIIKLLGNKSSVLCQNHKKIKTIWSLALDMKRQRYKLYWNLLGKRKEKVLKV